MQEVVFELNRRIILYLGFISYQIYFSFQPFFKIEITNLNINWMETRVFLTKILVFEKLDNKIFNNNKIYSIIKKYNRNFL
jgi:hypothetical protein